MQLLEVKKRVVGMQKKRKKNCTKKDGKIIMMQFACGEITSKKLWTLL